MNSDFTARRSGSSGNRMMLTSRSQAPPFLECASGAPDLVVGSACTGWATESQALTQLGVGHRIAFICDSDPKVQQFLRRNLLFNRLHRDVHDPAFQSEEAVDIFMAGCPCQPYSSEGDRLAAADPRSLVENAVLSYATRSRPKCMILENVIQWQNYSTINAALKALHDVTNEAGRAFYNVYCKVLKTDDFGVPQRRKRVYVVAVAAHLDHGFEFPEAVGCGDGLTDILDDGSAVAQRCCSIDELPEGAISTATAFESMVSAYANMSPEEHTQHIVVDTGAGRGKRYKANRLPTLTATRCTSQAYYSLNLRRRLTLNELA